MKNPLFTISCIALSGLFAACAARPEGDNGATPVESESVPPSPAALATRPLEELLLPAGRVSLKRDGGAALREALPLLGSGKAVFVLQYDPDETPSSKVRKAVSESGATLLAPVSGGAYLARATAAQALSILDSGTIAAAREYLPSDKIASGLNDGASPPAEPKSGEGPVYVIILFADGDSATAQKAIAAVNGCEVLDGAKGMFRVRAAPSALLPLASLPSIQSIGQWLEPSLNDPDVSRQLQK